MIDYYAIGLLYTYKCTGTCDICGLECGPHRNEKMDFEIAKKIIKDAAKEGIKLLGITGGEPFIYYEEILKLCKLAHSLGMQTTFTTNGFWASDDNSVTRKLKELKKYGVRSLKISMDEFHMKHIPIENYQRIFKTSQILDIKILIGCTILKSGIGLKNIFEQFNDEMINILFCQYRAYPVGDAMKMDSNLFYLDKGIRGKCNESNMLLIEPNGAVYPCGSACVMSKLRELGNVYKDPFETILEHAKTNIYTNYILHKGTQGLIDSIKRKNPGLIDDWEYVDICHACYKLFNTLDKEVIEAAMKEAEE